MTRFLVSIFHFLVILFAILIILISTIFFSTVPIEFLSFFNTNLSSDELRFYGAIFGFILGTLFVLIFFGMSFKRFSDERHSNNISNLSFESSNKLNSSKSMALSI